MKECAASLSAQRAFTRQLQEDDFSAMVMDAAEELCSVASLDGPPWRTGRPLGAVSTGDMV